MKGTKILAVGGSLLLLAMLFAVATYNAVEQKAATPPGQTNPLDGLVFYAPTSDPINTLEDQFMSSGKATEASLVNKITSQPRAIWLNGPYGDDVIANRDLERVRTTSASASSTGTVPVYQLYALPNRDACAGYSGGGFRTGSEYMSWVEAILDNLQGKAVFLIEADAVAHAVVGTCLSAEQIAERYDTLRSAIKRLSSDPKVIATYLDAGHPEWVPASPVITEALTRAGADEATGIVANVSFFADTDSVADWSRQIVASLGGKKGIVIDTSRNGQGAPAPGVAGEARWCNPAGRGLGPRPTTDTSIAEVHAFMWVKTPGDSDGSCFGYPASGTLVPDLALGLARNAAF